MSRDEATQKAAAIEWTHEHGAPEPRRAARAAVQDWHACALDGEAVARSARRRSDLLRTTTGARILVKQFLARDEFPGQRALKRLMLRRAEDLEWRALLDLAETEIAAPRPLLRARVGSDAWLVVEFEPGRTLSAVLASAGMDARRALLRDVGALVRSLHEAGRVHGDLHVGNILIAANGPRLLDLQRSRATRSRWLRDRDIAALDFSLQRAGVPLTDRARLQRAALGDEESTLRVRSVEAAARARARDYARGRTRRCTKAGRRFAPVEEPGWSGLQVRELSAGQLHAALEAHHGALERGGTAVLKDDSRARVTRIALPGHGVGTVVVKEVAKRGAGRALADGLRGSSARRGWIAGHGLAARAIGTATPLAYLEAERGGAGRRSLLVLEDLGVHSWLEQPARADDPELLCRDLLRLLRALHEQGVHHGDLQVTHLYGAAQPRLIDLEGVRFGARCTDEQRIQTLAELNASIPDDWISAALRRETFERYARALPFERGTRRALRDVVRRSVERRHRWTGADSGPLPVIRPSQS